MHKLNTEQLLIDEGQVETETERPSSIEVAIIFGETGYIITTSDCIHSLYKLTEDVEVPVWVEQKNPDGSSTLNLEPQLYLSISLARLRRYIGERIDIPKWIHYWGIKPRVERNYALLRSSIKEIEGHIELPNWVSRRHQNHQTK